MSDAPPPPPGPYGGPLDDGSADDGAAGTSGTTAPASPPGKSRWKAWVAAGAAAAVVVAGGVIVITRSSGSSSAQSTQAGAPTNSGAANAPTSARGAPSGYGNGTGRRPGGRGTQGTISAINGSTLTVQTSDQTGTAAAVEVKTTDSTLYTAVKTGGPGDLTVGDNVVVTGQAAADGSVTAMRIADRGSLVDSTGGVPGGGFPGGGQGAPNGGQGAPNGGQGAPNGGPGRGTGSFTAGSIVSVDGSTILVQAQDGSSVTVTASATTMVTITSEASLSDLAVGDAVRVVGSTDGATVTATAIQSGDLGAAFGGRVPPSANGGQMTPPTTAS